MTNDLSDEIYEYLEEEGPATFSEIRSSVGEGNPKETYTLALRQLVQSGSIDFEVDDDDRIVFYTTE